MWQSGFEYQQKMAGWIYIFSKMLCKTDEAFRRR